jgi:hypothetical protein
MGRLGTTTTTVNLWYDFFILFITVFFANNVFLATYHHYNDNAMMWEDNS